MRKFLVAWTATTQFGSIATGRAFAEATALTEEAIRTWEAGITAANGFQQASVMHVTEVEG